MYVYSMLLVVAVLAIIELPIEVKTADATAEEKANYCEGEGNFVYDSKSGLCLRWTIHAATFFQAMSYCEDYGGRLAVFDTDEKFKAMREHNYQRVHTWVGMDNRTGVFRWFNGKPLNMKMASKHFLTKPRVAGYDCVYVNSQDNLLANYLCDHKVTYVCEKPV